jgi:hypothetical protein
MEDTSIGIASSSSYIDQGESLRKIAAEYSVSYETIRRVGRAARLLQARHLYRGDTRLEVRAGQVVQVSAAMLHKFINSGEGLLRQTSIHPSPRWIEEQLES